MDYRLVEASPGIRAVLLPNTPDFTIVTVSDDYVSSTGIPREVLKDREFFKSFPGSPQDKDFTGETTIRASLEWVLQHKAAHLVARQRYDIPNGDGTFTERYWKAHNVPVLDEAGNISYLIHTAEDITGQVKAEMRQQQVEGIEKVYELFMQAPVAVCIVSGKEHLVELANAHMLQFLGRTEVMVGKPIGETLTEAKKQGLITVLDGIYATGKPYHAPVFPAELLIHGERERRYFDLVFQPYYQKHGDVRPTSIICMAYNITEQVRARQKLQESQQELQLAISAADLGTFRLDLLINQATNSQKVNEWFGYTVQGYSREEGFNPIHPEDRSRVDEIIVSTLQSEANSRHDVTYRVVHPQTGIVRHLRSFGKAMYSEGGKPYLIIGIIQDVTSQILHHQQLKESEALLQKRVLERTLELENLNVELQRSNKNLEDFAYAASHDMKEPIRKIHFFADRLRERLMHKMEEEDRRYFDRLEAGTKRMATLIDDLLLYSHVNRGVSTVETVDLNQMLSFVLDDLELHIEEKGAKVEVAHLPTINGRPRQLQQLFENLIGNALKYSKQNIAPVVHVTARLIKGADTGVHVTAINKDQEYYLIEVSDNGIGFEQNDAERIFNVFTRLHGNAEYRGTGVGLSIAQKVIENHHGYIWAESTPGEGATFKVLLPAE